MKRDQMASFFSRALGLLPIVPPPPTIPTTSTSTSTDISTTTSTSTSTPPHRQARPARPARHSLTGLLVLIVVGCSWVIGLVWLGLICGIVICPVSSLRRRVVGLT